MYEKVSKTCSGDGIKHKMAAGKRAAVDFSPALASFEINASRILFFISIEFTDPSAIEIIDIVKEESRH